MRGTVWLISYPKSGNTWLRFIVFHLVNGRLPESSKELDGQINSHVKNSRQIGAALKKSHGTSAHVESYQHPENRTIYMYRHPLDVMQSALNYARLTGEFADPAPDRAAIDAWIARYIAHAGHPLWREAPYCAGSWVENVESWSALAPEKGTILSYETALADPEAAVTRIAGSLSIALDPDALAACVAATSFDGLRAFEQNEIAQADRVGAPQGRFSHAMRQPALKEGLRFFNVGRAGTYRTVFTEAQIEAAWHVFAPVAERLGYER